MRLTVFVPFSRAVSIFFFKNHQNHHIKTQFDLLNAAMTDHHEKSPRWLSWMRRPTGDQEVVG